MAIFDYNENRDAWGTIRGFVYQVDLTVLRWLKLRERQHLELECGEDIDVIDAMGALDADNEEGQSRCLEQVKRRDKNISLANSVAREAMSNFADHLKDNDEGFSLTFRFVTTAGVAVETNGLPNRKAGIHAWEELRKGELDANDEKLVTAELRTFLAGLTKPANAAQTSWDRFQAYVADVPPDRLIDFVKRFEWVVGTPDNGEIQRAAKQFLVDHFDVSPKLAEAAYARLFFYAFNRLSLKGRKKLTPEEVTTVLMSDLDTASLDRYLGIRADINSVVEMLRFEFQRLGESIELVYDEMRLSNQAVQKRLDEMDPASLIWRKFPTYMEDFRVKLASSSKTLLGWKSTLEGGTAIERPELETIRRKILEDKFSTTLLLGPPGVGKSSLLATLARELRTLEIPFWALKADAVPRSVDAIEDLSRDLFPRHVSPVDVIKAFAEHGKVVLLVDQLDAVSQLMDQRSDRLVVLLRLINTLSGIPNVHVVTSCREFEAKYDVRLKDLELHRMGLALPDTEVVESILAERGIDPAQLGCEMIDMLRNPWNLNTLFTLNEPAMTFTNDFALREAFWNKQVMVLDEGREERVDLIGRVVRVMLEEEDLWLPVATIGGDSQTLRTLEASGILTRDESELFVGFRHQTLFEYSLSRQFVSNAVQLPDVVKEKETSLFVRPILINALRYLREMRPKSYAQSITQLVSTNFRRHIRALVIEYLSCIECPNETEIGALLSVIERDAEAPKVFVAVSGKEPWFLHLIQSPTYNSWLQRPVNLDVRRAAFPLRAAIKFATNEVLSYIQDLWLHDSEFDGLVLDVLADLETWTPEAVSMIIQIAHRTDSWLIARIASQVRNSLPDQAPAIVRADLSRRLAAAEKRANEELDSEIATGLIDAIFDRPREPFRIVFNQEPDWYDLSEIAEAAPRAFVQQVWPWFLTMLGHLRAPSLSIEVSYYDIPALEDRLGGDPHSPPSPILDCLKKAIEREAVQDPAWYFQFAATNAASDDVAVHRLLAYGFAAVSAQHPKEALDYLVGDPRRLKLGDHMDGTRETELLIRAVAPHVTQGEIDNLADKVKQMTLVLVDVHDLTVEQQAQMIEYERLLRFQVIDSFPEASRSPALQRWLDDEAAAIPGARKKVVSYTGGVVGARMTAEEMEDATNVELLSLFDALPDATASHGPGRRFNEDVSRAGGAIQQAREFVQLAIKNPDRAQALLAELQPGQHEGYAAAAIEGLIGPAPGNQANVAVETPATQLTPPSKGPVSTSLIETLLQDLVQRGFGSQEFRRGIAHALSNLAQRDRGLSPQVLTILEDWYFTVADPKVGERRLENVSGPDTHTSIFRGGYSALVVGLRGSLQSVIADGYLLKSPADREGWMRFVERLIPFERHPDIWGHVVLRMISLFRLDKARATRALDSAFKVCPELLSYRVALIAISNVMGAVEPQSKVKEWLERLRAAGTPFALNGYGQLLFLHYIWFQDAQTAAMIREQVTPEAHPRLRLGLAHAAGVFWNQERAQPLALHVLMAIANSNDAELQNALGEVFAPWNEKKFFLDHRMQRLLTTISQAPEALFRNGRHIVKALQPFTDKSPDLVYRIVRALVNAAGDRLGSHQTDLPMVSGTLTEIVLTLHRVGRLQEQALTLFEDMLDLNLREAQEALGDVDDQARWMKGSRQTQ